MATKSKHVPNERKQAAAHAIGYSIFLSRWLQAPLYFGLIIAQVIYVVVFLIELWHLIEKVIGGDWSEIETVTMLSVLALVDVVMISNLLIMVIVGGYETFVSRIPVNGHPDQPEWLSHVNANVLKVKLAMAIIGISSIHLLRTFIGVATIGGPGAAAQSADATVGETYTWWGVFWQVAIHLTFIISALGLAWIDKMSVNARKLEHEDEDVHGATIKQLASE